MKLIKLIDLNDSYSVMMAPSPSKSSKTQHPSFLITTGSVDTSPVPSSPPSTEAPKSQCSSLSDGESFECYGDNDISISENGGVDLELAPHLNSTLAGNTNVYSVCDLSISIWLWPCEDLETVTLYCGELEWWSVGNEKP
uniref:Uncharacterized protein n=1 Tax=Anopheles farauti TaxID=69004 RepID=A0A182Q617_9DIPT